MSKKESALDLAKLMDKGVRVKLAGGREGERQAPASNACAQPAASSAGRSGTSRGSRGAGHGSSSQ